MGDEEMRNGLGTRRRAGAVCFSNDGARIRNGDAAERAGSALSLLRVTMLADR